MKEPKLNLNEAIDNFREEMIQIALDMYDKGVKDGKLNCPLCNARGVTKVKK
jgi:hypothetical protein